jgi:hypothetical protein
MHLFEFIQDDTMIAKKLKKFYKSMGYYCRILPPTPAVAVHVADNPKYVGEWNDEEHTSMFFYFYPAYKRAESFEDLQFICHINSISVKKSDRGKSIAKKFIDSLTEVFGNDLLEITYSDYSEGFWEHMRDVHPEVVFINQD